MSSLLLHRATAVAALVESDKEDHTERQYSCSSEREWLVVTTKVTSRIPICLGLSPGYSSTTWKDHIFGKHIALTHIVN